MDTIKFYNAKHSRGSAEVFKLPREHGYFELWDRKLTTYLLGDGIHDELFELDGTTGASKIKKPDDVSTGKRTHFYAIIRDMVVDSLIGDIERHLARKKVGNCGITAYLYLQNNSHPSDPLSLTNYIMQLMQSHPDGDEMDTFFNSMHTCTSKINSCGMTPRCAKCSELMVC